LRISYTFHEIAVFFHEYVARVEMSKAFCQTNEINVIATKVHYIVSSKV